LLEYGADANATGGWYVSGLQEASYRGHEKIVSLLLEYGADVNIASGRYGSALRAARARDHGRIVKLLLDHGAVEDIEYASMMAYNEEELGSETSSPTSDFPMED
jgi:ankyrin repeat protein